MLVTALFLAGVRVESLFFFFQAEDGIRDVAVTGVQTCALPILVALNVFGPSNESSDDYFMRWIATAVAILDRVEPEERPAWLDRLARSTYRYVLKGGGEVYEPLRRQIGRAWGRERG